MKFLCALLLVPAFFTAASVYASGSSYDAEWRAVRDGDIVRVDRASYAFKAWEGNTVIAETMDGKRGRVEFEKTTAIPPAGASHHLWEMVRLGTECYWNGYAYDDGSSIKVSHERIGKISAVFADGSVWFVLNDKRSIFPRADTLLRPVESVGGYTVHMRVFHWSEKPNYGPVFIRRLFLPSRNHRDPAPAAHNAVAEIEMMADDEGESKRVAEIEMKKDDDGESKRRETKEPAAGEPQRKFRFESVTYLSKWPAEGDGSALRHEWKDVKPGDPVLEVLGNFEPRGAIWRLAKREGLVAAVERDGRDGAKERARFPLAMLVPLDNGAIREKYLGKRFLYPREYGDPEEYCGRIVDVTMTFANGMGVVNNSGGDKIVWLSWLKGEVEEVRGFRKDQKVMFGGKVKRQGTIVRLYSAGRIEIQDGGGRSHDVGIEYLQHLPHPGAKGKCGSVLGCCGRTEDAIEVSESLVDSRE